MPPKRKAFKYDEDDEEEYVDESTQRFTKGTGKGVRGGKNGSRIPEYVDQVEEDEVDEVNFLDYSFMPLKKDHSARPIWIAPNGVIILEAFSPLYQQAYDFLVAIAEPISRPVHVHRYLLTPYSLYAAVAVSIDTNSIIDVLGRLCKTDIPPAVIDFIRSSTATFGKARLVLKDNKFFVESSYPDVLRLLLKHPVIAEARVLDDNIDPQHDDGFTRSAALKELDANLTFTKIGKSERELLTSSSIGDEGDDVDDLDVSATNEEAQQTVSFMVNQDKVQDVKRSALDMNYPLMEEYDFRHDLRNPTLDVDLKPTTRIRIYQEKSLSKMFGNGRARSGIVVLPCGAGKSLTGVTAATTLKKSTMVLCINNVSVKQWKDQFLQWTTIKEDRIKMFTAQHKEELPPPTEACIVLTTYTMISYSGNRAEEALPIIEAIQNREWGLMILDEVHVAPASKFRDVLRIVNAHCKMGLTATLVREDDLISNLNFLVGPKLYEANWMDLTQQGYLASVQCCEVWCPMTAEFYREYLSEDVTIRKQKLMYILNPHKFRACEYLVKVHQARGDKIIIFSDDIVALTIYCAKLDCPYIYGETSEDERRVWLNGFKNRSDVNVIGLSKVGDTALDIPEANVIIQVSSHFGARRQEAQRLGRILRPKASQLAGHAVTGFNAFFYTLVSTDTREMYFSTKRQQYLVDQGYTFKVVQDLVDRATKESKILPSKKEELDLLTQAKNADVSADSREDSAIAASGDYDMQGFQQQSQLKRTVGRGISVGNAIRSTSTLGAKSGGAMRGLNRSAK